RWSDVDHGGARKCGSWVLTPDLVVMAKVGASGSGVSLFLIVGRIWENCSCNSLRTLEGKDHRRCLFRISIPTRLGWSACIHQPRRILCSSRILGRIASEMEEMLMGGDMSSHKSSWYWTYSSIRFHPSSSVREPKRN
ncbi:hypothetical protein Tco_1308170, partial [Tanacetum coccineum]